MSIIYVSAKGLDTNDGLTPETAIRTIAKANELVEGGDEIRFRRGDTFYGMIKAKAGIDPDHPTTYTAYGEGKNPVVTQYKSPKEGAWEKHADGVYKLELSNADKITGNVTELDTNVGFMKVDGRIYYRKVFAYEELSEQWDFYCDNQYVYVKLDDCPCKCADEILFACNIHCLPMVNNLKVTNISFIGTGAHGMCSIGKHVYVADCEFLEIGGSCLVGYGDGRTRYGNGIEFWANSTEGIVERCKFSDIYDVAITMQGNNTESWENMYFRNNVIWNCTQAFEIWSGGKVPGTGFVNCHFEDNVCIDSGICWGYAARPNKSCATHLLIYHIDCDICDITVRGNVFSKSSEALLFKHLGVPAIPKDYKIFGNTIISNPGEPIIARGDCPEDIYEEFVNKIRETNCVYTIAEYNK